jgi:hypothetical protein
VEGYGSVGERICVLKNAGFQLTGFRSDLLLSKQIRRSKEGFLLTLAFWDPAPGDRLEHRLQHCVML